MIYLLSAILLILFLGREKMKPLIKKRKEVLGRWKMHYEQLDSEK